MIVNDTFRRHREEHGDVATPDREQQRCSGPGRRLAGIPGIASSLSLLAMTRRDHVQTASTLLPSGSIKNAA
jgi:hypothetical protein